MVLVVLESEEQEEERPCEWARERASRKVAEDRGEEGDIIEDEREKAETGWSMVMIKDDWLKASLCFKDASEDVRSERVPRDE